MEPLSPWDELLTTAGKTVEDAGRMLRGKDRKSRRVWSISELTDIRDTLTSIADVLDKRINDLKVGNQ
jgi:hypothetical protein